MIKLGIIYTSYGMPEYIVKSLLPWIKARREYDIKIAGLNAQFKEYHEMGIVDNDTDSEYKLMIAYNKNLIDHLEIQRIDEGMDNVKYETETQIRNRGLQFLLKQDCTHILIWDGDEVISEEEIDNLFKYLDKEENQFTPIYKIEYKNLINDENHYIRGFNPKRIWKVDLGEWKLSQVIYDNDFSYIYKLTGEPASDSNFAINQIPTNIINPLHYSWLNNERSKNKINYQLKRWGICSYKWNSQDNKVEFDYDFYRKNGLDLPVIYKDD